MQVKAVTKEDRKQGKDEGDVAFPRAKIDTYEGYSKVNQKQSSLTLWSLLP